jgi:hypothetical protein
LGSGSKSGLGDISAGPFRLPGHFGKNLHMARRRSRSSCRREATRRRKLVNLGRNYWTFEPVFAITYLTDGG